MRGSFSAVSTPIFATKYSFCSIFRDLQDLQTSAPLRMKKSAKNRKTDRKKKFRNLRVPMQEIPPCRCKNHKYQCCAPDAAVIFRKLSGLVKTAGCRDLGQKATSEGPKTSRNRDFRNWRVPMLEFPPQRCKNLKYIE